MPQLQKGTTYTGTGVSSFVTHTNLNAHVDNAKLLGGAIDEQVSNSVSTDQDLLLVNKGGDLFKQTKGQFNRVINSENITSENINVTNLSAQNCTGFVPVGSIIMWSGTEEAAALIPNNWRLCDGTNGTPDLRNRFIVGAGDQYDIGDTGGTESVTLTNDHIPEHSHEFRVRQADYVEIFGSSTITVWDTAPNWNETSYTQKRLTSPVGKTGEDQLPVNTTPPYYAVAYIMRMS
jgi:microcystin-dependent protein